MSNYVISRLDGAAWRIELNRPDCGNLVYSTAEVDARTAQTMGLVSLVVPDGQLQAQAGKLIETISSQPLDAVQAVKEFLKFAPQMEPRGRADFAASVIAGVLSSR